MQCPRCGATAPDTMSRCGRCDTPLQAAPAAHEPTAASGYDSPPPIQHTPPGAPIYEGGGGPPVQAFVDSAEDSWHPLGQQQFPPSTPSTTQPTGPPPPAPPTESTAAAPPQSYTAPPQSYTPPPQSYPAQPYPPQPSTAQDVPGVPGGEIGEPPGEATQMWTPPPDLGPPSRRHAAPEWNTPQPPMAQPPMPPMPPPGLPQDSLPQDESVTERTMAVWFSDPPSAAGPVPGPDAGSQTPVYGTAAAPPQGGQGRNETAMLPDLPPVQQPGGWSPEAWQQPAPGGFGPGGEPGTAPPQRPASGPSKPLIITVTGLVAVALVAAVMVLWPDGGGDKTSSSSGPSQAAAQTPATSTTTSSVAHREAILVNRVLNASAASRGELARALAAGGTCKGLPTAINGFERVAAQRRSQSAHTRALKVGRLPNGVRLRQSLARSIQYSLAADQALLTWSRGRQGCHGRPKPDANFRRAGGQLSAQASAAKSQFATLWAPVAKQHHLPARTANSF